MDDQSLIQPISLGGTSTVEAELPADLIPILQGVDPLVGVPPTPVIGPLYRAIRAAGRHPLPVVLPFPNMNTLMVVMERLNDDIVRLLREVRLPSNPEVPLLGYHYWNTLFQTRFGIPMRRGELHRHDYLHLVEGLNILSKSGYHVRVDRKIARRMAKRGYLDYFTDRGYKLEDEYELYGNLCRCAINELDRALYDRLEAVPLGPNIRQHHREDNIVSATRVLPLEWLQEYIGEHVFDLRSPLQVAARSGDREKVDYLYTTIYTTIISHSGKRELGPGTVDQFISSLMYSGNVALLRHYYGLHPIKFIHGWEYVGQLIDPTRTSGPIPPDDLYEIAAIIRSNNPLFVPAILQAVIGDRQYPGIELVRRLIGEDRTMDSGTTTGDSPPTSGGTIDLESLLVVAIRSGITPYQELLLELVTGGRLCITDKHLVAAYQTDNYVLLHTLTGLLLPIHNGKE